jgi:hypothetical protein
VAAAAPAGASLPPTAASRLLRAVDSRRVRRGLAAAAVIVLVAGLLLAFAHNGGGHPTRLTDRAAPTTTALVPLPTISTLPAAPTSVPGAPITAPDSAPSTAVAGAPTTVSTSKRTTPPAQKGSTAPTLTTATVASTIPAYCHDSYAPECGPFRYTAEPQPNRPMVVTSGPTVTSDGGHSVTVTITYADPDATAEALCTDAVNWGDGTAVKACANGPASCSAYGPWDPPSPAGAAFTATASHTYAAGGSYLVQLPVESSYSPAVPRGCPDPYHDTMTPPAVVATVP